MKNYFLLIVLSIMFACHKQEETLFVVHEGRDLGIDFQNTIATNDSLNALSFEYIYNGSGVGIGDFNNDGLEDIFFGGNQVSSRLYLNEGTLHFRDITADAKVKTDRWITGVSVVDINNDGWLDIFLAVAGIGSAESKRDLLFINQGLINGVPVFHEQSKAYGLDDDGYGTMGAFFDYDKDGDLDLYLLTNALESFNRNNVRPKRMDGSAASTDRLYRNNGNHTFTNVSQEAGITIEGYGLGVNICDINQDGWPDVYVSNDFLTDDFFWINNQDGTFTDKAKVYLRHETHNGMGNDVADFNNDARADIVVVDMLPSGHRRQKMMTPGHNYDNFYMSLNLNYAPQYMRNTLQLNRGTLPNGELRFSEIAFQAGVAKTDWSWAPLFADYDNDGWKDLFIANGYRKDVTDLDFIFFGTQQNSPFGTAEVRRKKFSKELEQLGEVKLNNYVFSNAKSLTFDDKTEAWGLDYKTFSNGAAYADLDNDGDLDLITNNIDQDVTVYENTIRNRENRPHYIKFQCKQKSDFNEKIFIYNDGHVQFQELTPYRGFQSTVTSQALFGLGDMKEVDSVIIKWDDDHILKMENIPADTLIIFSKDDAHSRSSTKKFLEPLMTAFSPHLIDHHEKSLSDIKNTRTLIHELSRYGPCVASGDVNGDNLDDLFVGGETGVAAKLYIQTADGGFQKHILDVDSAHEDGAAAFFDADHDGDLDLYVGSTCPTINVQPSFHQLLLNDGHGIFKRDDTLPQISTAASCVRAADFDRDGDIDLFVGGRMKYNQYPLPDRSYVLKNEKGKFVDVTAEINPALQYVGLVNDAQWADFDKDGHVDLIVAGEWMPLKFYKNDGKKLLDVSEKFGFGHTTGWWRCIKAEDVDQDGWIDIIAGNTGKNSFFQPSVQHPLQMIAKDFDKNGSVDPIVAYFNTADQKVVPVHNRLVIIDQIPGLKKRFEKFSDYAGASLEDVFNEHEMDETYAVKAETLSSYMFLNKGGKEFTARELPELCQISTVNDVLFFDVTGDNKKDMILIGNDYAQETLFGRYDAFLGCVLVEDQSGKWINLDTQTSGFVACGDARQIRVMRTSKGQVIVVANNSSAFQFFKLKK
jgi:hypothetical protein